MIKDYGKLIYIYDLQNKILKKFTDIQNEDWLHNPYYVLCFKIKNKEDFEFNDLNVNFENFPWITYYKINPEILSMRQNNNRINAWYHWISRGKREERAFSYSNNTNNHRARFGNLFFLNMCLSFFSQKFNLKSNYKYESEFNKLGIYFYKGENIYNKNYLLTDYNFENLLESDVSAKNIIIDNNVWFHTNRFCKIIKTFFEKNNIYKQIKYNNYYNSRYNNNNDLFIHIRLGDVADKTKTLYRYFNKTIQSVKFSNGYISSDDINNKFCRYFIDKYKLKIIKENEINTIMFGSTCKNIILSGGTFSWLIGFLAIYSNKIFYPDLKDKWYGDIFSFSNWIKVS